MPDKFVEIDPKDLQFNPFEMIGDDWMLITAGNDSAWNTMTASYGQMGSLWGANVATVYVRPQRYTKQFLDQTDEFTLCFFGEEWREALDYIGTHSGRDTDKAQATHLTPQPCNGSIAFEEAQLVLVCHKLYAQDVDLADFIDTELAKKCYPKHDPHTFYVGRIDHMYLAAEMFAEDEEGECECGCGGHHDHEHGDECCCHHHED